MKFKIFRIRPHTDIKVVSYDITLEPCDNFPYFLWDPALDRKNLFDSYEEAEDYLNEYEDVLYNYECVILPYWKSSN